MKNGQRTTESVACFICPVTLVRNLYDVVHIGQGSSVGFQAHRARYSLCIEKHCFVDIFAVLDLSMRTSFGRHRHRFVFPDHQAHLQ